MDENTHTWCYYYQKAELARQYKDWDAIGLLWDEAIKYDFRPANGFEFLPFIEANAYTGNWEAAYDLTRRSNLKSNAMYFLLCPTWERLVNETPPDQKKSEYLNKAYEMLNCSYS